MTAPKETKNRFGQGHYTDPVYAVSNLSSLFSVCAIALDGLSDYDEAHQERGLQDVKHTLELCAVLAVDVAIHVEKALAKGGVE
ncbi:hypothetical protein ASD50_15210 [Mesorhizobium sp. Root552]|jgi:hypothetical protein|uniref:hypothetical protein n=1 Tax=Mesorhizobium sp. Root552 TaxID=1736555 RepID=UPI000700D86A|nr:hypothetical protein [Mesorhizobium sp. Root552]KQZ31611.1 hypothetical protein ASD50_15210 [Mesorhizobium sp. Root552]